LILEWLSKQGYNSSRNYSSVFPEIVEMSGFVNYFGLLSIQTEVMKRKQVLRAKSVHNDMIVKMAYSSCEYLDEKFFEEVMGENDDDPCHPVNVVALRFNWILKDPKGKEFLDVILRNGELSLYDCPTLQMIIEFLFKEYKKLIWTIVAPLYLFSHVTFECLVSSNDEYIRFVWANRKDGMIKHGSGDGTDTKLKNYLILWSVLNFVAMSI
jgi:hypothetical protein